MHRIQRLTLFPAAVLGLAMASCGGGPTRVLESISISPNPAVSQNGQVQLVAAGTFNTSPRTVSPLAVSWFGPPLPQANPVACAVGLCPSVTSAGLASCGKSTGNFTVTATAPSNLSMDPESVVTATATLSCTSH
jgi:hypothetical protein